MTRAERSRSIRSAGCRSSPRRRARGENGTDASSSSAPRAAPWRSIGIRTVPRRPSAAGRKLDAPARAAALRRRGELRFPGPRRAVRHPRARRHALRLVRDDDREGPRRRSRRRGRLGQSGNRTRRGAGRRARRRAAHRGRPGERLRRPDGARRDGGGGRRAVPPRGRRPAPPDRRRGAADGARPRALDGRRDVPGPQPRPPRPRRSPSTSGPARRFCREPCARSGIGTRTWTP